MTKSILPPAYLDFSEEIDKLHLYEPITVHQTVEYVDFYTIRSDNKEQRVIYSLDKEEAENLYQVIAESMNVVLHQLEQSQQENQDSPEKVQNMAAKIKSLQDYGIQHHRDHVYVYRYTVRDERTEKNIEKTFIDPIEGVKEIGWDYYRLRIREQDIAKFFGYTDIKEALNVRYVSTLLKYHDFSLIEKFYTERYNQLNNLVYFSSIRAAQNALSDKIASSIFQLRLRDDYERVLNLFVKEKIFKVVEHFDSSLLDVPLEWLLTEAPEYQEIEKLVRDYITTLPDLSITQD